MDLIKVSNVSKTYKTHLKQPGFIGSVKSLFKRTYSEKTALENISFSVQEGEIVGLLGANGAGKTTLLKILSGIIQPTGGIINVLGYNPWNKDNGLRKQIALVMGQKAQLWWDLTAADCFLLLKEIYQIQRTEFENTIRELGERLDVHHLLNVQIRQLSLGERMKMELLASLLHRPKILFLDEPTIGLDVTSQRVLRDFILEYIHLHRPAVILTSHYMEDIKQLCKRILIVRGGHLIFDGSLTQILSEYSTVNIIKIKFDETVDWEKNVHLLSKFGKIIQSEKNLLSIEVDRVKLVGCINFSFENFLITDLAIEEVDSAIVFERILKNYKTESNWQ